jgi:hypothetical protein
MNELDKQFLEDLNNLKNVPIEELKESWNNVVKLNLEGPSAIDFDFNAVRSPFTGNPMILKEELYTQEYKGTTVTFLYQSYLCESGEYFLTSEQVDLNLHRFKLEFRNKRIKDSED